MADRTAVSFWLMWFSRLKQPVSFSESYSRLKGVELFSINTIYIISEAGISAVQINCQEIIYIVVATLSAESLNSHYANISTDTNYTPPTQKVSSANTEKDYVSEFTIIRILDSLRPTATALDLSLIHI